MPIPNLNHTNRSLPDANDSNTINKLQRVADAITQPQTHSSDLLNYDGEVVLAKVGTKVGGEVGDVHADAQAEGEATTNANAHASVDVKSDLRNGEFGVAGKAGAMVNTKVTGEAEANVMGTETGVTSESWAGAGVAAEGHANIKDGQIDVGLKLGAGVNFGSAIDLLPGNLFEADSKGMAIGMNARFDANPILDQADKLINDAEQAVNETATEVEKEINQVVDEIEEAVNEAADEIEEAVNEAADEIEDAVNEAADEVGEAMGEAADAVEDAADAASDFFGSFF